MAPASRVKHPARKGRSSASPRRPTPKKKAVPSRSPPKKKVVPARAVHKGSAAKVPSRPASKPAPKPLPKAPAKSAKPEAATSSVPARAGDSRRHVLSLSFLRDGDEFLARLETDSGHITELKNRSLDQLLTLVANELEDLLE
jgi:hypothetical protein